MSTLLKFYCDVLGFEIVQTDNNTTVPKAQSGKLARLAGRYFLNVEMPGALPVAVSAFVLMTVAVVASVRPVARAARVDVMQAMGLTIGWVSQGYRQLQT